MLSFELSAIDLILAIAVIILLVLYITRLSGRPPVEEGLLVGKKNSSEKRVTGAAVPEEGDRPVSTQPKSQSGSEPCPFGFGYLSKLDREASIPDGCLRCPRVMDCCSATE
jgi:hypothetical protein